MPQAFLQESETQLILVDIWQQLLLYWLTQYIGSRLGSTFVDGGVHPCSGTPNFTLTLQNGRYIEVVCPLDHPATGQTPWDKALSRRAAGGG